jgi:hypothetical protein
MRFPDRLDRLVRMRLFVPMMFVGPWVAAFFFGLLARAQATPPPEASTIDDVAAIARAYQNHEYVLLGSLIIGFIIAISKSGWLGTFIATKVPAGARPVIAVVLGALGMIATQLQNGTPWQQAALNGLYAGALAVLGHQTVIEGMRGGKEIIPPTKAVVRASMIPPANVATIPPSPKPPSNL